MTRIIKSNLKVIVFDVDGTLYDLKDVEMSNYKMQVDFFSKKLAISNEEAKTILKQNHIYPIRQSDSKSATEFFRKQNIDLCEWNEFRSQKFDASCIEKNNAPDDEFLKKCADNFSLYLLSSNSKSNILSVLKRLSLSDSYFKHIYSSEDFSSGNYYSKTDIFKKIITDEHIEPNQLLSIGDRFETDIKSITDLGGYGLLVKNKNDFINPIMNLLNKGYLSDLDNLF